MQQLIKFNKLTQRLDISIPYVYLRILEWMTHFGLSFSKSFKFRDSPYIAAPRVIAATGWVGTEILSTWSWNSRLILFCKYFDSLNPPTN